MADPKGTLEPPNGTVPFEKGLARTLLSPCVSNALLFLSTQLALVRHYSILEFPSMVVEVRKDDYHIVAG